MDTEGILCEVLSKLPAKSILRFRALSKTCSNFPSGNFFLKKHSEQLLLMDDPCFFIQQDQRWGKAELHSLSRNDEKKSFYDYGVPNSSLQFLNDTAKIVGSYNGLLVLQNQEDMGLLLCNPATQKFISIPKLTTDISDHSTFGIHIVLNTGATEFPDNYGVILVKPTGDWSPYTNFYMYIKGEAWKEMGRFNTGARNILYDMPVYCRGAIHFISDTFSYLNKASPDYKPYIVACEIDKITRRLKLPKEAMRNADDRTCDMRIFRWGKPSLASESSVCLVRLKKSVFTVWVLDDYEMGSWILVLKTRVKAMCLNDPDPVVCGFTVMNGDSLVFATDKRIYRFTLSKWRHPRHPVKAEEIARHGLGGCLGRCSSYLYLTCYANTLRPCGNEELPLTYAPINSIPSFGCELQEEEQKFSKSVYEFVCHFSFFLFLFCLMLFCVVSRFCRGSV